MVKVIMVMEITFLGTAAAEGFPGLFCNCSTCTKARAAGGKNIRCRSSVLVNEDLLVDYGPDTSAMALRLNKDFSRVRNIIVTHSHADHLSFHDLNWRLKGYHQKGKLGITTLWGNPTVNDVFLEEARGIIANQYPGIEPPDKEETREELEDIFFMSLAEIKPFQKLHVGTYVVHSIRAHHNEPELSLNYIIDDGKTTFLYGTDTGSWSRDSWEYLQSIGTTFDVVALDCTVGSGMPGGHHSTKSFLETRDLMAERGLLSDDATFIAHHFSHQWSLIYDEMVQYMMPRGVEVSYDGMVVKK
ncbi:MAG: MBL fold metallo-hydrolase [Promethearchaeota archaeon]